MKKYAVNPHSYNIQKRIYICALSTFMAGIIFLGMYHYFDYSFYGIRPPCGFKVLLHCYCPGCGGTRAVDAFLHGQLLQSIVYNPLIVYLFGLFLYYFVPATFTFLIKRDGMLYYRLHINALWGLLAVIVIHFVGRNVLLHIFHIDHLQDFYP